MAAPKRIPRIRCGIGQTQLSKPEIVDQMKRDMLSGNFRYDSADGRIFGWNDNQGMYYICEGHHRVVAALEILRETGDRTCIDRLLECGLWEAAPPRKNRRLPTRSIWSRLLGRFGW